MRIPILNWLTKTTKSDLWLDFVVGITVGTMLIPQSISYADIAGLGPEYGMYSCLCPSLVYLVLGTSPYLSVGPVALVSLLVESGLEEYSQDQDRYREMAGMMSLQVGILQFIGSILQAHHIIVVLGEPVISGFTSAASVIISLSQMKHLLGYDIPKSHYLTTTLFNLFSNLDETNGLNLVLGLVWFSIIFFINKVSQDYSILKKVKIILPLTMCLIGILCVDIFNLQDKIKVVGYIPSGLPIPKLPNFGDFSKTLGTSFTISLISYLESISIAKTLSRDLIQESWELSSLGISNILGSFLGGYPVAGSFSRTAVNHSIGCKTQFSGCFSSLVIVLTLTLLTNFFSKLPRFSLCVIIINSVMRLFDYQKAKQYYHLNKIDFTIWMITFLGCIFLGVLVGLLMAISFSFLVIIYHHTYPKLIIEDEHNVKIIKLTTSHLDYINIPWISKQIEIYNNQDIILDLDSVLTIDTTSLEKFKTMSGIIYINYSKIDSSFRLIELERQFLRDTRQHAINKIIKSRHSRLIL